MALVGRLPPSSCLSFILCRCWLHSFFILSFVRSYVFRICFRNSRPPKSCRVALYCSCTSCVCVCLQRQTFLARHVVGECVLFVGSVLRTWNPSILLSTDGFSFHFFLFAVVPALHLLRRLRFRLLLAATVCAFPGRVFFPPLLLSHRVFFLQILHKL